MISGLSRELRDEISSAAIPVLLPPNRDLVSRAALHVTSAGYTCTWEQGAVTVLLRGERAKDGKALAALIGPVETDDPSAGRH